MKWVVVRVDSVIYTQIDESPIWSIFDSWFKSQHWRWLSIKVECEPLWLKLNISANDRHRGSLWIVNIRQEDLSKVARGISLISKGSSKKRFWIYNSNSEAMKDWIVESIRYSHRYCRLSIMQYSLRRIYLD